MQHWYTWSCPDYKRSSLIFELLFCLTKEQCHVLLRARHQTWVCSEGEESGERALWFEWEDIGFTWGGVGNTKRIPYCFPTCYLQHHKQILKLYKLILKCTA